MSLTERKQFVIFFLQLPYIALIFPSRIWLGAASGELTVAHPEQGTR